MNNASLIGNIATDIDLRSTPNGVAVAKFNLAVTNPYNREKTTFVPIEVWRKQAENVSNYCSKGSKVGVVGHIEIDQFEKDGQKRTFTKVVAGSVEFLTPKSSGANNESSNQSNGSNQSGQTNTQNQQQDAQNRAETTSEDPFSTDGGPAEVSDDDLPF